MHWPRTGIKGELQGNEQAVLAHLFKIEPSQTVDSENGATEVQKLEFSLAWEHDNFAIAKIQEAIEKKAKEEAEKAKKAPTKK